MLTAPLHSADAQKIALEAKQGEFAWANLSGEQASGQITIALSLGSHSSDPDWSPAATIGYTGDLLRKNSFQLRLLRPDPARELLQLKYLIYKKGMIVQQAILKSDLPLTKPIKVTLSHDKGQFQVSIDGEPDVSVTSTLTTVTPYIATVSAKAVFEIFSINDGFK